MINNKLKKVITVQGEICSEDLGITLMHEHLLLDQSVWGNPEPEETSLKYKYRQNITLQNYSDLIYNGFYYKDNLRLTDVNDAINEAKLFRDEGGCTIVDVTNIGLGRDPKALYKISIETGLNIVMGCGNYVGGSWNEADKKRSEDQIAEDIVREFNNGVGTTGIKPGIIGEIGISDIRNPLEIKGLRGASRAQKEIGCGLTIHTPIWDKVGHAILDVLEEENVPLEKIILSHCDPKMGDFEFLDSLAKRGAYIEFDEFGMHTITPLADGGMFLPCDNERIENVVKHIKAGNIERILISHDVCLKILTTKYGGFGYGHILKNIVPRFLRAGLTSEQINMILIENPKRILSF